MATATASVGVRNESAVTLAMRGVSDVGYAPGSDNSSSGGWFGILGGIHEKDCVLFMSRLKNIYSTRL